MNKAMPIFHMTTEFPTRDITPEDSKELFDFICQTLTSSNFYHLIETVEFKLSKTDDDKVSIIVGVITQ